MILEYVMSGCAHLRTTIAEYNTCKASVAVTQNALSQSQDLFGHKYSLLYNGLVEIPLGKIMKNLLAESAYSIHADSGGLQIVTRGMESTPAVRDKVYRNQAKYADVAMSFDEIPVTFAGGRSTRTDLSTRFFDPALIKPNAIQSAYNIRRQIDVFREEKSKTKPFLILQGNSAAYYQQWLDIMLEVLGDEYIADVGGIALGSAALGSGQLEDVERSFMLTQLKAPYKVIRHLHTLGVGSVRRLYPFFVFKHSGMLSKVEHMSYDSTSHSSGLSYGNYYLGGRFVKLSRQFDENFFKVYKELHKYPQWSGIKSFKETDVYDALCKQSDWEPNHRGQADQAHVRHAILHTFVFSSMLNFTEEVDKLAQDPRHLIREMNESGYNSYRMLTMVRDEQDFAEWKARYGYELPSLPVAPVREMSDMFA